METARFRKLLVPALVLAAPLFAAYIALRSYRSESGQFKNQRHPVPMTPEARAIPGLTPVGFRSKTGGLLHGWYVPSRNRAAIVLTHGTSGDRRGALPEAAVLASHGFGVLLYDFPGHGESEGEVHWDEGEAASVVAALDFLAARADVSPDKLAVGGFSMGGLIAVRVAAHEPRVRALALVGTPPDLSELIRGEYRKWGKLAADPALLALTRHGMTLDRDRPIDVVAKVAPRELLIVGGADDQLVPKHVTEAMFAAARAPKELYFVPGASHGNYFEASPREYPARLVAFFSRALGVPPS
jgi:pimeloyl-ACP methyl ester carboxylesterase